MTSGEAAPGSDPLLAAARRVYGVTGGDSAVVRPALATARQSGVGVYPLAALGLLLVTLELRQAALLVFAPEISDDLGIGRASVGAIGALALLTSTGAALGIASLVGRAGRRAQVVLACGLTWCVATAATGFVHTGWQLAVVAVLYGLAAGSVPPLHAPLLVDAYPPAVRARTLSTYAATRGAANVVAPLVVGVLASVFALGWRPVLLVLGAAGLALTLPALGLRDPEVGRWDAEQVRALVNSEGRPEAPSSVGLAEAVQHLVSVPTVRRLLVGYVGIGMTFVPLGTYLLFFLRDEWGLTPAERSLFFGLAPLAAIVALAWSGRVAERLFRADPRRLVRLCAAVFAAGVVLVALAVLAPVFPLVAVGIVLGLAAITAVGPGVQLVALLVVPPPMRSHLAALSGLMLAGVGGLGGLLVLDSLDERLGNRSAIALLTLPAVAAAVIAARAADTMQQDLDRLLLEILDEEQAQSRRRTGHVPVLECSRLLVQHDGVAVLNGVDVVVDAGELVALVGTNGAGKTTLLNCVSGLRPPDSGIVRLSGRTLTYLPAEQRVALGIAHLPAAGGAFPPLSVRDNLLLAARASGLRRRAVGAAVDATVVRVPELEALLDRPAGALSGGQQRLVALARVLLLRPKLLLVDELALGLSPALVSRTVALLHELCEDGAAVLVVEQSVDRALAVAARLYVLDGGEVRFAGTPDALPDRLDLVRATFLGGTAS